jgi:hypothetical protein
MLLSISKSKTQRLLNYILYKKVKYKFKGRDSVYLYLLFFIVYINKIYKNKSQLINRLTLYIKY